MENSKAYDLTEQMKELHQKQTERMKELEERREEALEAEKFDKGAVELHNMYQSYVTAGFSEEQAWTLVQIVMSNATKRTLF